MKGGTRSPGQGGEWRELGDGVHTEPLWQEERMGDPGMGGGGTEIHKTSSMGEVGGSCRESLAKKGMGGCTEGACVGNGEMPGAAHVCNVLFLHKIQHV